MKPWVCIPLAPVGYAYIDKRDAFRVCRYRWRRVADAPVTRIGARDVRLSRFIMQPGAVARVLNRSGDHMDCRRENLRVSRSKGRAA